MGRLTPQERQRAFLARQQTNREILARLTGPITPSQPCRRPGRRGQLLKAAMLVALLGAGWFVSHTVEFHLPASIAEARPRL